MRLTRLRFILFRTFWISIFVTIFLQLFAHFTETSTSSSDIFDIDRSLNNEKRIEILRNQMKINEQFETNWTKIFQENYLRRLITLNERDAKTNDKHREETLGQSQRLTQSTINIYEETTVRK